jgi:hypothetical protein
MPVSGSRTFNVPVKSSCVGFMLENAFCQRTPANIAQTNHEYAHGTKITDRLIAFVLQWNDNLQYGIRLADESKGKRIP